MLIFGFAYGAAMGSFGGVAGERAWQLLYSAVKAPLLLLATFAIGLPFFFVLNTLYGLRRDFREALRRWPPPRRGWPSCWPPARR